MSTGIGIHLMTSSVVDKDTQDIRNYLDGIDSPIEDVSTKVDNIERAPKLSTPSVVERAKAFMKEKQDASNEPKKTARKTPVRALKEQAARVPVDRIIARGWQFLAQMVAPINVPVARVLDMQAPVAGLILENNLKGSVVDRILQPLARVEERGEVAFALLGPPVLVAAITARPQMAGVLIPILRESLKTWLDVAGPSMKIVEEREADFEEKYGARIDTMISYILGPLPEEPKAE